MDADNNNADLLIDSAPVFWVVENIFCVYFAFEVSIRFTAFREKRNCIKDAWFMFDSALVALMIFETWVLSLVMLVIRHADNTAGGGGTPGLNVLRVAKMAKMFRVSRMARLLRQVPELMVLLKDIGAASRTVSVFSALWLIIVYVFAVVLGNSL